MADPRISALTMPKWGLTMTEGRVVGWLKDEGQSFAEGDEVLEIETTKITNVVEADAAGTLRRIVAAAGAVLPVGGLLAVLAPPEVPQAEIDAFVAGFVAPAATAETGAMPAGAAPRDIDAGGRRLRVLEIGDGGEPPIVFIHGFGADLNTWMFNQPALAEARPTVSLDLPGHGGSQKTVGGGDLAGLADAVIAALDALAIARAHLVGHSMGGAIAASLAQQRPERVASATLIAAGGLGREINMAFIDGLVRAQRRRDMQEVLALLVHDPALLSRQMVEDMLRYKRLDGVVPALEAIARSLFAGGVQQGGLAAALAAGLPMPVQVIWGREDRIIPVAHAEALAGRLPVHIIDGAGHLPHMEKAAEVNRLIRRFVG